MLFLTLEHLFPHQNLNSVMVTVAQLLHTRMPGSYEVAFPRSPGRAGVVGSGKTPDSSNPGNLCPSICYIFISTFIALCI